MCFGRFVLAALGRRGLRGQAKSQEHLRDPVTVHEMLATWIRVTGMRSGPQIFDKVKMEPAGFDNRLDK